ncbi:alpha/beta hydrolase [Cupriavidus sp. SK-4]|uniref:RBBP9/YdeN family alpha/beta hydrolase n=1 Tax=Cupriavidus sp. SK-4 TaxID=574750 RepID=UPI00044F478D|nr:alpha/beta fold hydrolase [Cupriavidus sp. SK-4]EYS87740.1 alpha/beta hydrolase [Cupriavidus sp. SK-4]
MTATPTHTVLMVPGLRDHVAEHWQTLLQAELQAQGRDVRCVPPLEHDKLSCAARVAALDATLAAIDKPVVLVAHSAGVMITVHWAARHQRQILGALLVTPPDFAQPLPPGYPAQDALVQGGWLPTPLAPLPFPTLVAASGNDPLASHARVAEMAAAWGGRLVDLGNVGHLNPAAGYGPWPRAHDLLAELGTLVTRDS